MNAVIVSTRFVAPFVVLPGGKPAFRRRHRRGRVDLVDRLYSTDPARRIADGLVLCCDLRALPHAVVS